MHPYVIDRMVQERRDELTRMARMAHRARLEGRPERPVGPSHGRWWRTPARPFTALAAAAGLLRRNGRALEPCPGNAAHRW